MIFIFILFLVGLTFGSFLNSLIYRIDKKKSFRGRSYCPKCKKKIIWCDNVPIVSYLLLAGKCRNCKKQISIEYPIVEMLTGLLFVLIGNFTVVGNELDRWMHSVFNESMAQYAQFPTMAILSLALLLTCCFLLLAVAIYDSKTKYVLTYYAYAATTLAVLYNIAEYFRLNAQIKIPSTIDYFLPFILAALIPASIFWVASKASKEKIMGSGDADIALAIGFLLGFPKVIPAYYFAFLVGAAYGISLLITKRANMKSEVPFGPFLISGAFFSLLFGEQIIAWYDKMFLVL